MKRIFPSLAADAHLGDVFQAFPKAVAPLLEYHDILLRGPSDLSVAERELIAAFVSGLNACAFCYGAHAIYAKAFGIDPAVIAHLIADIDAAPADDKIKPLLRYAAKLTQEPTKITEEDAANVYAAGWSEAALFDAIQTTALFNFMNRIVEGSGLTSYPTDISATSEADLETRRTRAYSDWGREVGIIKE